MIVDKQWEAPGITYRDLPKGVTSGDGGGDQWRAKSAVYLKKNPGGFQGYLPKIVFLGSFTYK